MSSSANSISGASCSSIFILPSSLEDCARSSLLKIVSCIPVIGMASTIFAYAYVRSSLKEIGESLENRKLSNYQANAKMVEAIEWIQVARDHGLASVIRQVVNIALIVLGITGGSATSIGISVGLGVLWAGCSIWVHSQLKELSALAESETLRI